MSLDENSQHDSQRRIGRFPTPASKVLTAHRLVAAALTAALVLAVSAHAEDAPRVVCEEPWSCYFGGEELTLHYRVIGRAALGGRAAWSFAVHEQVVARREATVTAAPGRSGLLEIRLELPTARPGIVIPATVTVALDAGPRFEHRLWIFPEDPFADRRAGLKQRKIALFDPEQKTARLLEQCRVSFRPIRSVATLGKVEDGVVVVGEGVSFREWRTLVPTIIQTAARGVPVICLAPAGGELKIPGIGDKNLPRPTGVFLRRADAITAFDKRLDTSWPPDGKAAAAGVELNASRTGIVGEITSSNGGWPWLEVTFPAKRGRLILCGFAIVTKWDAGPTPRYLLANLLEHEPGEGVGGEKAVMIDR